MAMLPTAAWGEARRPRVMSYRRLEERGDDVARMGSGAIRTSVLFARDVMLLFAGVEDHMRVVQGHLLEGITN